MSNTTKTQAQRDQDFLNGSKSIDLVLMIIEFAVWKFLALTTAITIYSFFDDAIQQYFLASNINAVRGITITSFYLILDFGGTKLITYYWKEKDIEIADQSRKDARAKFLNIVLVLFILRFAGTTFSTFIASPTISEFTVGESNEDVYFANISKKDSIRLAEKKLAIAYSKDLQKSHTQRIKTATSAGNKLIKSAIKSGNKSQQKSYREEKFSWIETNKYTKYQKSNKAYAKRIRTAISNASKLIEREESLTKNAELATNLNDTDTTYNKVINLLADSAKKEIKDNQSKINTTKSYIYMIDFFAAILGLFITYARHLRAKAGNQVAQKTIIGTFFKFLQNLHLKAVIEIEKKLKIDLNKDGVVGENIEATSQSERTNPIPVSEEPIIGFKPSYMTETDTETKKRKKPKSLETTDFLPVSKAEINRVLNIETEQFQKEVSAQIKHKKRQIQSYQWKLRNNSGKPETANRNIAKFTNEIQALIEANKGS